MRGDIEYIIEAHEHNAKKPSKAVRKWDGKTPYYIHPLWCATTIASETTIDETTRNEGILALLYHDVLEDTTKGLPEGMDNNIGHLIKEMTFEGGSEQEMREIWNKPRQIRLYKLYDKVSNLLDSCWMDTEKRAKYIAYTKRLCEDVNENYGELNITKIAEAIWS
jgi:(p)ppGpp synthase/HD superfamily hydrolase